MFSLAVSFSVHRYFRGLCAKEGGGVCCVSPYIVKLLTESFSHECLPRNSPCGHTLSVPLSPVHIPVFLFLSTPPPPRPTGLSSRQPLQLICSKQEEKRRYLLSLQTRLCSQKPFKNNQAWLDLSPWTGRTGWTITVHVRPRYIFAETRNKTLVADSSFTMGKKDSAAQKFGRGFGGFSEQQQYQPYRSTGISPPLRLVWSCF